jgi:phage terminase small subunit
MTPEQSALFAALTPLQKEIVTNVLAGMKPIDAYRASSGKAKEDNVRSAAVNQVLSNIKVIAFLKSVQEQAVDSRIMTRDEALQRLSSLARTRLSELVVFTDKGWDMLPSALQDPEKLAAIAELTATKDGPKIKLHSPLAAIKQIAEIQGWTLPTDNANKNTIEHVDRPSISCPKE